jgi:hypothetical protein
MGSFLHEDIYIFNCPDAHRTCFDCFLQHVTMKRNDNQLLTCNYCDYPLEMGEIEQLRISEQERMALKEYQTEKSLAQYRHGNRGVICCPKQNCKWMVEAFDPTERIRVICQSCQYEFCSLCNEPYHYRTACREVAVMLERWMSWCTRGMRKIIWIDQTITSIIFKDEMSIN